MVKTTLTNFGKVKVLAFVFTITLVVFYNDLPKRTLVLIPQLENFTQETTDQVVSGNSEFSWINKNTNNWACTFKNQYAYPYCNLSLAWSGSPFKTIDFSPYTHIKLDLEYKGNAKFLRIFVRNEYHYPNEPNQLQSGKFNTVTKQAVQFEQPVSIYFNELRVSDWWIDNFQVPPEHVSPDVSATIALGIDIPHPAPLGRHEFRLRSLTAIGDYFSKEVLYFSIIIFWTVLLLGEIIVKFIHLQNKSKNYGKVLSRMSEQTAIYKQKAETDKLTRILNREGLSTIVEKLAAQGLLPQYALIVLDLDHFKHINDEFGHTAGDSVLQDVAKIVNSCMRSYDIFARWGGEEFVILFHCLEEKHLLAFAEKIRKAIESATYSVGKKGLITASIGVSQIDNPADFEASFEKADKAVYAAKEAGRNRVIVS